MDDNKNLQELDKKLDRFEKRIIKKEEPEEKLPFSSPWEIIIEMVAAMAVGGFLGWQADKYFGTKPLFFLIGFFLGVAGWFYNVYKRSFSKPEGKSKQ